MRYFFNGRNSSVCAQARMDRSEVCLIEAPSDDAAVKKVSQAFCDNADFKTRGSNPVGSITKELRLRVSLGCHPRYSRDTLGARRLIRCSSVLIAVKEIRRICFSSACFWKNSARWNNFIKDDFYSSKNIRMYSVNIAG